MITHIRISASGGNLQYLKEKLKEHFPNFWCFSNADHMPSVEDSIILGSIPSDLTSEHSVVIISIEDHPSDLIDNNEYQTICYYLGVSGKLHPVISFGENPLFGEGTIDFNGLQSLVASIKANVQDIQTYIHNEKSYQYRVVEVDEARKLPHESHYNPHLNVEKLLLLANSLMLGTLPKSIKDSMKFMTANDFAGIYHGFNTPMCIIRIPK